MRSPRPGRNGGKLAAALTTALVLTLGGCATVRPPVVRTVGNADRLLNDPRFEKVLQSNDDVKAWAYDAVHTVNDLEYEARVRGYGER